MNWLDRIEIDELEELKENLSTAEQVEQSFKITDLNSLNWALRKLSSLDKKRAEEAALANAEIDRINVWFAKQDITYQESRVYLEGLIKEFAKSQRVIDPKWKQKTPYGLVSFRKAKKFDYGDEEKLTQFLDENGMSDYVKVVKSTKKAELKKAVTVVDGKAVLTETGEVLPITVEEVEDVTIKLES
jgi:hypothetical protein